MKGEERKQNEMKYKRKAREKRGGRGEVRRGEKRRGKERRRRFQTRMNNDERRERGDENEI